MKQPSNTSTLYAALAKAQGEMPNAILNKVNPHFRNKYADLASLRAATLPVLSKHGLCVLQYTTVHEVTGALLLHTRLAHESGEYVEGAYPLPNCPDKPQQMGSALTYARRYGWGAILGEASDEDDDANAVQGAKNGKNGGDALISDAQRLELEQLADAVDADLVKYYEWLRVNTQADISTLADIPASKFQTAKAGLEAKRKAKR